MPHSEVEHIPQTSQLFIRAREFDREFTVLRAIAPAGPENGKCVFFDRREMFICWAMFFLRARDRSWRDPETGMFFSIAGMPSGSAASPPQARNFQVFWAPK